MACANLNKILVNESGRIGSDINRLLLHTSPWLALVIQEAWPDEMGDTVSVMVYERSLPNTQLQWNNVLLSDGSDPSSCLPPVAQIEFGQTLRQYNLQNSAIHSPKFCVNDLRFPVKRKEQLSNIFEILKENTQHVWIDRYRSEYIRIAQHKVIAKPGFPEGALDFPIEAPTTRLTNKILRHVYMRLQRDGAGNNPLGRENNRPVYGLILSSEASDYLIAEEETRKDWRDSAKVNELLAPLGIERSYNGYFHMIDDFAPRHNLVLGSWVEVFPYVQGNASQGKKWTINPDYENAETEDTVVFHRDVFRSVIPKPITSPGGNTAFNAVDYRGNFQWKNIENEECNPDGTIGFFRAVFSSGSKPLYPQYGFVIRHLRCGARGPHLDCADQVVPEAPVPTVSALTPATGTTGTVVTIAGTGFTGATGVQFDGIAGTSFSVVSDNLLRVNAPAHANGKIDVVVVHPNGNSTGSPFTYAN